MKLIKKLNKTKRVSPNAAVMVLIVVMALEVMILGINYYFYYQEKTRTVAEIMGVSQASAFKNKVNPAASEKKSPPPAPLEVRDVIALPVGYTLDSYTVEEVLTISCKTDNGCRTPEEYLLQSRCPFTAKCINDYCTVVCPGRKDITWADAENIIQTSDKNLLFRPSQR